MSIFTYFDNANQEDINLGCLIVVTFSLLMQFLSAQFDNRTKFLALFLVWTLCLGLTTLEIQHSCNPMIGKPLSKCSEIIVPNPGGRKADNSSEEIEAKVPIENDAGSHTQPTRGNSRENTPPSSSGNFIPVAAGAGGIVVAGAGASALASAGLISTTITMGGAVIATPVAVAVAAGVLVFLAVRSLTGGA